MRVRDKAASRGFSLVELMVSVAIGLIAVLAMSGVFLNSEGQRRTTSGGSDAQTAATVGLYTMERDIAMAGYALNHADFLSCQAGRSHDGESLGSLFPVRIQDGGSGPDTLVVTWGNTLTSGFPTSASMPDLNGAITIANPAGCTNTGFVAISAGGACSEIKITNIRDHNIIEHAPAPAGTPTAGAAICLNSGITQHTYAVSGGSLTLSGPGGPAESFIRDVVSLKAQYGVSASADSDDVTNWVSATGSWATPSAANRQRIKAIRLAIVTRSAQPEKEDVSSTCTTAGGTLNQGPCLWNDSAAQPAPAIDLSGNSDWRRYRYRVHSTVVVPRNLMWKPPS